MREHRIILIFLVLIVVFSYPAEDRVTQIKGYYDFSQ